MLRCSKSFVLLPLYCGVVIIKILVSLWYTRDLRRDTCDFRAGGGHCMARARLAGEAWLHVP